MNHHWNVFDEWVAHSEGEKKQSQVMANSDFENLWVNVLNEWMNEWMNEWLNEEWMNEKWMNGEWMASQIEWIFKKNIIQYF